MEHAPSCRCGMCTYSLPEPNPLLVAFAETPWPEKKDAGSGRLVTCVYCGFEYPSGTPTWGADILTVHIRQCKAHPMRAVESALAAERERRERAERVKWALVEAARRGWRCAKDWQRGMKRVLAEVSTGQKQAEAENGRLRDALAWYGNLSNYVTESPAIAADCGLRARAALAETTTPAPCAECERLRAPEASEKDRELGWLYSYRWLEAIQAACPFDGDVGRPSLETIEAVIASFYAVCFTPGKPTSPVISAAQRYVSARGLDQSLAAGQDLAAAGDLARRGWRGGAMNPYDLSSGNRLADLRRGRKGKAPRGLNPYTGEPGPPKPRRDHQAHDKPAADAPGEEA